jgi:hypothetical protein
MEAVSTSETSVNFYQTTMFYIPENSLHIRRRENLKSYLHRLSYIASIEKMIINDGLWLLKSYSSIRLEGLRKTSQKRNQLSMSPVEDSDVAPSNTDIFTAVRTSNLQWEISGKLWYRWEDNIKIHLGEIGCTNVNLIEVRIW